MREFSASSTTNRPAATRTSDATGKPARETVKGARSIVVRLNEPESLASTRKARNNAGSEKQAKVTSRAAPIPSNDEPVSSAAVVVKKRARPKRYANKIKSPVKRMGLLNRPS